MYLLLYFGVGILLIYLGTKSISKTELIMLFFFFIIIIMFLLKVSNKINYDYLDDTHLEYLFLPYGVILFSLWGASIIPETSEILGNKNKKSLKNILTLGIIIAIITYLVFILSILGTTGPNTTTDSLTGLMSQMGNGVIIMMLIFGILTTFTSFLTLGVTLKKIFWYDLKLSHLTSWLLTALIPVGLYFSGFTNFITIIGFVGAVTLGFDTITTILCYQKAKIKSDNKPVYSLSLHPTVLYALTSLFLIGIIVEIINLFNYKI